jgi:hypothetical protein
VSCETVTTVFVSRPPPCTGGNEARDVSAGSSIVETAGSVREEPEAEHHLHVEKARGSLRTLHGSGYLGKNTDVIHESLLLYFAL